MRDNFKSYHLKMFRDKSGQPYYRMVDEDGIKVDQAQLEYDPITDSYFIAPERPSTGAQLKARLMADFDRVIESLRSA